jgi:hypothetical protein
MRIMTDIRMPADLTFSSKVNSEWSFPAARMDIRRSQHRGILFPAPALTKGVIVVHTSEADPIGAPALRYQFNNT